MMRAFGWIFVVVGVIGMTFGYASSGAASYSDTLNIGLLNDKANATMIGGFLWLAGVVLLAAAEVVDAICAPELPSEVSNVVDREDGAQL